MFAARQGFNALAETRTAKILTVTGSAAISTSQHYVGTSSLQVGQLSTNNNYASVAWNAAGVSDLNNIDQWTNWTCEAWVRHVVISNIDDEGRPSLIGAMEPTDWPLNWNFGATRYGSMVFSYRNTAGDINNISSANSLVTAGTWYHMAVVKQGTAVNVYLSGTPVAGGTITGTISSAARPLVIGSYYRIGANAYVDEVRISKTARYLGAFTPPSTAFTNDSNTLLLLHAEGADGSTTILDDAG